jgi:hypothetical protein
MGFFLNLFLFIVALGTLAVSGGFATDAAVKTTKITGYSKNQKLRSAHARLSWAAVITWITVALIVVLAILFVIFVEFETAGIFTNIVVYVLLFMALGATIFVGVLSAIAAADINSSGAKDRKNANRQAVIAAILAIVGFVGLVGILIYRFFGGSKKKDDNNSGGMFGGLTLEPSILAAITGGGGSSASSELAENPELLEAAL